MEADRMGCPNCKNSYMKVIGNALICTKCGHTSTPQRATYEELESRIRLLEGLLEDYLDIDVDQWDFEKKVRKTLGREE